MKECYAMHRIIHYSHLKIRPEGLYPRADEVADKKSQRHRDGPNHGSWVGGHQRIPAVVCFFFSCFFGKQSEHVAVKVIIKMSGYHVQS